MHHLTYVSYQLIIRFLFILGLVFPAITHAADSYQFGRVDGITDQPMAVSFSRPFNDPVVVTGGVSTNDSEPGNIEISDITSDGFTIRFREWDYLDGTHSEESVDYLVIERGISTLDDGGVVIAGTTEVSSTWQTVPLDTLLDDAPIVIGTVVGYESPVTVASEISGANTTTFRARIRPQESIRSVSHTMAINWVAWPKGAYIDADGQYSREVKHEFLSSTGKSVSTEIPFDQACIIAATANGFNNPANLRYVDSGDTSQRVVTIQEEQSKDSETSTV